MITLTCINCPMGCRLTVSTDELGNNSIEGSLCKLGIAYAHAELTNPTRIITSTVRLCNAAISQLPVKTSAPIPKAEIKNCMLALKPVEIDAPVYVGDVIIQDVCDTGIDIIATRSIHLK